MKKRKLNPLTVIYFFDGEEVRCQSVLTSDLPRLSGGATFWRESMPQDELAAKLKARIGLKLGGFPQGSSEDQAPAVEDNLPPAPTH